MAAFTTISGEPCDMCGDDAECEIQAEWRAGDGWVERARGGMYVYILCAKDLKELIDKADREAQIAQEFADAALDWRDSE